MKSNIDITEFKNKLKVNTKIGSPKLKIPLGFFSIFSDNSKCFYGNFDNSTFELTTNSNFFPTSYFLKGIYKYNGENLIVDYTIEPTGKLRIAWIKYFPIIAIIMFNCIFYFQAKPPIEIYIIFNLFIVFVSFFSRLIIKWKKEKMEKIFKKVFVIVD